MYRGAAQSNEQHSQRTAPFPINPAQDLAQNRLFSLPLRATAKPLHRPREIPANSQAASTASNKSTRHRAGARALLYVDIEYAFE